MSEPEALPAHIHQEAVLLPWYANGTLSPSERQQVDRHLTTCPSCRMELEELTRLQSDVRSIYASQPGPSAQTARTILDAVAHDASARRRAQTTPQPWLHTVDQWFRSLLQPRWVPTLAAIVLLTQIGLVLWLTAPQSPMEPMTTRTIGPRTDLIAVTFQSAATESDIRAFLHSLHGRIVDGPTTDGLYTIEVLAADESIGQKKLALLRSRTDLIRSASPKSP